MDNNKENIACNNWKTNVRWNVCLSSVVDHVVQPVSNGPSESGAYLCTCVRHNPYVEEDMKYLQCMYWNAEKQCWSDLNRNSGVSHIVLAWTNDVPLCEFAGYQYNTGGYLTAKE